MPPCMRSAPGRQACLEGEDRGLRPCDPVYGRTAWRTSPAATRSSGRFASATARKLFTLSSGAYTGASPAIANGRAYFGTYKNEVLGGRFEGATRWSGATGIRSATSRFTRRPRCRAAGYSSAAATRSVHAPRRRQTGKAAWTFKTARAHRLLARDCRRPRLRRLERRQALRLRCRERQERAASSKPVAAVRLPRHRRRPPRHRLPGRQAVRPGRLRLRVIMNPNRNLNSELEART